ncbi:transcription termination/antitermination protein NusG [Lachnoanaerobaculum umeaense]|jgi:transcription termination/antitermination factor nusG|uniref:Transcription termination/antitermination protein NusG n=1 Tax=Lachnoanaerobaculum umeaense TaxID=617123 RepID=A0A385PZ23_9FIRM|nr:transcription termination/antitermination protein NusG [Lachnoanaerobaculum umeaense]AYA99252.1 transcription termination/antitermination factor NusG [Lachnoanaerobaculum umeaense]PZW93154.1 transcription antitermination protein nusG [Lachnoanaerobaculum umeaense]
MAEAQWFVAHTYSGYENKVKVDIEKTIENRGLQDQILEVTVPMETILEVKNGVEKSSDKKLFPGYVLIHMYMNDETWYVVRNTRGVTGFVGPGSKPVPLTNDELAALGYSGDSTKPEARVLVDLKEGDMVTVISGAWKDTVGVITAVNEKRKTVSINVEMFGRETKVELEFTEVKKM